MSFINECFDFMLSHDLGVSDQNKIKLTGDIERFTVTGDKRGSLNGWMIYRDDLKPSCTFGSWKTGELYTWFAEDIRDLPKAEQQRIKKELMQSRVKAAKIRAEETKKQRLEAAQEAFKVWESSSDSEVLLADHQYVKSKMIKPYFCRVEEETGCLIVPMLNQENRLSSIQRIYPNGRKIFLSGGAINNCFVTLDVDTKHNDNRFFICEGWATGCTVHQITKEKTIVCFNANNLDSVTAIAKINNPDAKIFICADNDHQTIVNGIPTNIGEIKANEAAKKHGAQVIYYGTENHGTDWNDYMTMRGFDETCAWFSFRFDAAIKGEPEYV